MRSRALRLFATLLFLALASCAARGQHQSIEAAAGLQPSYERVALIIVPQAKNADRSVEELRAAVAGQLIASGRFRHVAAEGDQADIVIRVTVTEYRRLGNTFGRALIGGMTGRNQVGAEVVATDGRTAAVLRHFQASGRSGAYVQAGEAEFADALKEFSVELVRGLTEAAL